MIIIIGLGNPEEKYQRTGHNVGQQAIDLLQNNWQKYGFTIWKKKTRLKAEISEGYINNKKIFLIKSLVYMNDSGLTVALLKNYYKIKSENFWIIHDDIDLKLGIIKIVKGRGSGGHRGVVSIIQELKIDNITRFKIGICPKRGKPEDIKKYVLKAFDSEQEKLLEIVYLKINQAIEMAILENIEKAMNQFNQK